MTAPPPCRWLGQPCASRPDPVPRPVSGWKTLYKNQTAAPGSVAERGASTPLRIAVVGEGGAPWSLHPHHLRSLTTQAVVSISGPPRL